MLAKALAKESGATFINIAASVLTNKWFGESNKLVAGLFSLARKTQPSIIFIDEIDSFLRERSSGDHEVTAMMKAEFMTCVCCCWAYDLADALVIYIGSGMAFYHRRIVYWFLARQIDQMTLTLPSSGDYQNGSRLVYPTMNND